MRSRLILVGGVGQLYQGDLDLGRVAVARLCDLPPDVLVEDLSYGAVAVVQRLEELRPERLVLVGAVVRGRPPGTVERREIRPLSLAPEELQLAVGDAVTGYVTLDLLLEVATAFSALPADTVAVEVEPVSVQPSESLSPAAEDALERALELVRVEVTRAGRDAGGAPRPAARPR